MTQKGDKKQKRIKNHNCACHISFIEEGSPTSSHDDPDEKVTMRHKKKHAKTVDNLALALFLLYTGSTNPRKNAASDSLYSFPNFCTRLHVHRGIAPSTPQVRKNHHFFGAQLGFACSVQKSHENLQNCLLFRNNRHNDSCNNMSNRSVD